MERRLVASSNIKSVGYDGFSGEMEIEFHSGRVYSYATVPTIVHDGLLISQSPGRFLKDWIVNRFPSRELTSQGGTENA